MRNSLFNETWKSLLRQLLNIYVFIHEERFIFGVSDQFATILIGNLSSNSLDSKQETRNGRDLLICNSDFNFSTPINVMCFLPVAWRSSVLNRFGSLNSRSSWSLPHNVDIFGLITTTRCDTWVYCHIVGEEIKLFIHTHVIADWVDYDNLSLQLTTSINFRFPHLLIKSWLYLLYKFLIFDSLRHSDMQIYDSKEIVRAKVSGNHKWREMLCAKY